MHAAVATSMAIFHALLSGRGVCAVVVVHAWQTPKNLWQVSSLLLGVACVGVCALLHRVSQKIALLALSIFAEPGVDKVQARRAEIQQPRTCVLCVSRIMGVYALALGPSHC